MTEVDMNTVVGEADIVFITLDTLRYDVAQTCMERGETPNLERLIGNRWELRHSPGTFTYAAHQAFFAGFLPTPATGGLHPRLFAARFAGSETTVSKTAVFDAPNIVQGLGDLGYRTLCIGGVGFFNQQTALGSVLPSLFEIAEWDTSLGVTDPDSTRNQFQRVAEHVQALEADERIFAFINVSALHQPNHFYLDGASEDSLVSHAAALRYVDSQIPLLTSAFFDRPAFFIICSDHGTAYGEDGFSGHRNAHPTVTHVPYAHGWFP